MKFAILADIHANWPALEAVLADLAEQGEVHQIYCLGDIIGYYPFPGECVDAVIREGMTAIRGNHERYLLAESDGEKAKKASTLEIIEDTRKRLDDDQMAFLAGLKNRRKVRGHFLCVHGSPRHPDEYLIKLEKIINAMKVMAESYAEFDLCFFGHTHKPLVVAPGVMIEDIHASRKITLEPDKTYLVNPGSVGQPRDGCNKASYVIYDAAERAVQYRRVDYPYELTQQAVLQAGYPDSLADRLAGGR